MEVEGVRFLRQYRYRAGFTQKTLAEKLEVAEMTIRRWEVGIREPRASDIKKLCEVLNITEVELLNGPQLNEIEIRLVMSLDPMKGGVTQMDIMNGNAFTLCVEREHLGIIGSGKFEDENDIDSFLSRAKAQLMLGLKVQKEQRELKG